MIERTRERLGGDERAVSPVVGFVLMFALIMIVFTLYQTNVVPAQNTEVEFKHSQQVEADLSQLNDAIQDTGASGVPQSVTVATGVQYPDRALAINPGTPVGSLGTVDAPNVTLSGLSDGSGYWSGGETFETHLVSYMSNYNRLQQETRYTLENGMMVKDYDPDSAAGNLALKTDGSVISNEGRQINLVLVGGSYSESSITTSATVRPVSTSTAYLSLNASGSNPSVTIPTTLPQSNPDYRTWDDIVSDNNQIAGIENYITNTNSPNAVILGLKKGQQYSIRLSKVTFGSPNSPALKYLKSEDGRKNRTAAVGTPETFTVSAHDEFGNSFPGAKVTASIDGDGSITPSGAQANNEGRASFTYKPVANDADSNLTVDFKLMDSGSVIDTVSYNLTVPPEETSLNDTSEGSVGVGDIDNGYTSGVITDSVSNSKQEVTLGFENLGNRSMTAKRVRVNGFLQKSANAASTVDVLYNGTSVEVNGNVTPLEDDSEYTVPPNGTRFVTLDFQTDIKKGGFLIISVEYVDGTGRTDVATYAVAVTGK